MQSAQTQTLTPAIGPGTRIGALDGVRAFAVSSVLVSHSGFNHGGWVGVDTFFVLSGFLITCLLLGTDLDRPGLMRFWSRRFRRLLPGFLAMVMVVTALLMTNVLMSRAALTRVYSEGLWSVLYVGNWYEVFSGADYWNGFATSPFGHLWSLGIEEQYYLLFPLFIAATARFGHQKRTMLTLAIGAASAMWAITLFTLNGSRDRIYFGTDTRIFALMLGATAAMVMARPVVLRRAKASGRGFGIVGALAFVALIAMSLFSDGSSDWLYRGGMAATSALSLLVVLGVVVGRGPLDLLLNTRVSRWIGERSYGIYLWHLPVFVFLPSSASTWPPFPLIPTPFTQPTATLVIGGLITCGLAALSHTFIEMPIRTGGGPLRPRLFNRQLCVDASSASLAAIASAFVILTGGLAFAVTTDAGGAGRVATVNLADFVPAASEDPGQPTATTIRRIKSIAVVGDSIAILIGAFSDIQGLTVSARGFPGCGFLSANERLIEGEWKQWSDGCADGSTKYLKNIHDFDAVMLVWGRWDLSDVKWQGATLRLGTPEYEQYLFSELDKYDAATRGAKRPLYITSALCFAGDFDYLNMPRPLQMNELLQRYADTHENVFYLPLIDFVCKDGKPVTIDGQDLRPDTVHFSPEATSLIWKWMLPYILGTKNPKPGVSSVSTTSIPVATVSPATSPTTTRG